MSHPAAHTLEHIEKQQRSITPQPSTLQSQTPAASTTSINVASITLLGRSKRRNKTVSQDTPMSTSASVSQDLQPSVNQSTSETNGSSGFLRIQSPTNTTSSNITNHQTSNIITPGNTNPLASLFAHVSGNAVRIIRNYILFFFLFFYSFFFLLNFLNESVIRCRLRKILSRLQLYRVRDQHLH